MITKEQILQNCTVEGNVVKLPSEKNGQKTLPRSCKSIRIDWVNNKTK